LDFSAFPTVLLLATLLRLALNIASTRVVLLEGHAGGASAGKVIEAFGEFVIGGNYAVGLIVFVILIIINFVVVTKGAGRVSEVTARFTLDAMPGKQMAIDADLNAGLLSHEDARARREDVARESDFYGAMDGASKFVRGDAVAGLLITGINILGGLIVGMSQHGLGVSEAAQQYTLLAIGDGLAAQIPSLLLSTATAIIVTRVSSSEDMGEQMTGQLLKSPRTLGVTAGVMGGLGLVPGMPNLVFLSLAGLLAYGAWKRSNQVDVELVPELNGAILKGRSTPSGRPAPALANDSGEQNESTELDWHELEAVDVLSLEVGYRLIPLVERSQGGQLASQIKGVRKKLSSELGFLVHPVHIRDNLELPPTSYRVLINGVPMAMAEIYPERELAINPGKVFGELEGISTKDPSFGLQAVWIEQEQREEAQGLGYTVVDSGTVISTHLATIVHKYAHEIFAFEDAQALMDQLKRNAPKLVEELSPKVLPLAVITRVLQNLLAEGVPLRDLRTIASTLLEAGGSTQDADMLTAAVRAALARQLGHAICGDAENLPLITLSPSLEQMLQPAIAQGGGGMPIEPTLAEAVQAELAEEARRLESQDRPVVLVVQPALRNWVSRWLRPAIERLHVLSYNEIPDNKQLEIVATLGSQAAAS
ncbi:MAG: flagellar biosynthesis protein FlhA, partial [Pseudomonadales bacterium]|nr:flagellar biosynthesis protein FlhA [Pseudomonadales bacterium]